MTFTLADGLAIGGGLFVIACLFVAGWLSSIEKRRSRPMTRLERAYCERVTLAMHRAAAMAVRSRPRRHRPIDEHCDTHYQRHNGANGRSFR